MFNIVLDPDLCRNIFTDYEHCIPPGTLYELHMDCRKEGKPANSLQ